MWCLSLAGMIWLPLVGVVWPPPLEIVCCKSTNFTTSNPKICDSPLHDPTREPQVLREGFLKSRGEIVSETSTNWPKKIWRCLKEPSPAPFPSSLRKLVRE